MCHLLNVQKIYNLLVYGHFDHGHNNFFAESMSLSANYLKRSLVYIALLLLLLLFCCYHAVLLFLLISAVLLLLGLSSLYREAQGDA